MTVPDSISHYKKMLACRDPDARNIAPSVTGNGINVSKQALQCKLLDGLWHLVRNELKLNQPQASDGWLTNGRLWLVSKTVADKLRAYLLSQGIDGIPGGNPTLFDILQEHGIVQPTTDGKAIWKATVASATGWTQSLTFFKLAPTSIWDTGNRPSAFTGTVRVEQDADIAGDAVIDTSATTAASPLTNHRRRRQRVSRRLRRPRLLPIRLMHYSICSVARRRHLPKTRVTNHRPHREQSPTTTDRNFHRVAPEMHHRQPGLRQPPHHLAGRRHPATISSPGCETAPRHAA